jgi:oligopeptide/dipeptide ABC transporter ATP-binding protein
MCQRVMIALAAVCRPALLLADEPAAALDADSQRRTLELLGRINRDFGAAILLVSHDLGLVSRLCRRTLVMYAGKIVEAGNTEDVFLRPAHPYTQALTAAIPRRDRKGKALAGIPGRAPPVGEARRGCPFAPRCARAEARCAAAFPEPVTLDKGRRVHCIKL